MNNIPGVRVTMDTSIEKAMNMFIRDGTVSSSSNVDWGYTIMISRALISRIVLKLMQQLPPTPCYQL